MSIFSLQTWLNKGYSEEEAKYQIAIRRPNNVLYYTSKGYTEEEAVQLVKDRQAKGGLKRSTMTAHEKRSLSPRCIEFYLAKGLSHVEAERQLSAFQTTFSKEKCIKAHGEEEGIKIFEARQKKWQTTLNSKSQKEIDNINSKKNRWRNLTNDQSFALKEKISKKVKKTTSLRTIEERKFVGNSIRNGMVKSGRATPLKEVEAFALYKSKVWAETKRNDLTKLLRYKERGRKNYHLDHKYSIWQGFKNNVDPSIIGHINNLEMIPYQENLSKFNKCSITLSQLLESINDKNQNSNS